MLEYLSFGILALILGFKHSFDADHIIAVSNILRKARSMAAAVRVSVSWALGHMLTAVIVTVLLYIFRESLLKNLLSHFDQIVGFMLIILGIISFKDVFAHFHEHKHGKTKHAHPHVHAKKENRHVHKHMLGIGIIHGLASNDELLLLFTASLGVTTLGGIIAGVGIFSIGVVLGMITFAAFFSYPLIKTNSETIYRIIAGVTGAVSVVYGLVIVVGGV